MVDVAVGLTTRIGPRGEDGSVEHPHLAFVFYCRRAWVGYPNRYPGMYPTKYQTRSPDKLPKKSPEQVPEHVPKQVPNRYPND